MDQVCGAEDHIVSDELRKIVEDLSDPLRPDDRTAWEVRPLRDDDDFSHYPEYLDGDIPRYWWVSVEERSMVADLEMPSASRVLFMADMAQDEVIEETREARPCVRFTARTC